MNPTFHLDCQILIVVNEVTLREKEKTWAWCNISIMELCTFSEQRNKEIQVCFHFLKGHVFLNIIEGTKSFFVTLPYVLASSLFLDNYKKQRDSCHDFREASDYQCIFACVTWSIWLQRKLLEISPRVNLVYCPLLW